MHLMSYLFTICQNYVKVPQSHPAAYIQTQQIISLAASVIAFTDARNRTHYQTQWIATGHNLKRGNNQ